MTSTQNTLVDNDKLCPICDVGMRCIKQVGHMQVFRCPKCGKDWRNIDWS